MNAGDPAGTPSQRSWGQSPYRQRPAHTRRARVVRALAAAGLVGGLGFGSWLIWHNYVAHPTLAERRELTRLGNEPALDGLPGWKRVSYQGYSVGIGVGRAHVVAVWHTTATRAVVRRQLLAKLVPIYGPAPPIAPGLDTFIWSPTKSRPEIDISLTGDASSGTDISITALA